MHKIELSLQPTVLDSKVNRLFSHFPIFPFSQVISVVSWKQHKKDHLPLSLGFKRHNEISRGVQRNVTPAASRHQLSRYFTREHHLTLNFGKLLPLVSTVSRKTFTEQSTWFLPHPSKTPFFSEPFHVK